MTDGNVELAEIIAAKLVLVPDRERNEARALVRGQLEVDRIVPLRIKRLRGHWRCVFFGTADGRG